MASFSFLLLVSVCTIAIVLSAPQPSELSKRQALSSGTNNGYYYEFWTDVAGGVKFNLGPAGSYSVNWTSDSVPFLAGKGWNPGSAQTITYTGSFATTDDTAYLEIYGWTTDPLIEYHIIDSYINFDPSPEQFYEHKGNITSDGGTYDIYRRFPPNNGYFSNESFRQYWSVRTEKRVGGTVTTANHFDAWKAVGWNLSTFNYQLVAVEGGDGSGSASITVL